MESVRRLTQAYSLAPWRKQLQVIVFFLLILVLFALVAGIYLNVSARAVTLGHEIQNLQNDIEDYERSIADLETQLALLRSTSAMEERASDMGFRPAGPDDITYLSVPGYLGRQEAVLAPPPGPSAVGATVISPAYTESLIDWLKDTVFYPSGLLSEVMP
ncbi:MAG: hypothetical protein EHM70_02780 [Chloroflexota bacterium]|nr:MAG: hypothetical protein EHM70_02780 [Chloroflexota bacterium]